MIDARVIDARVIDARVIAASALRRARMETALESTNRGAEVTERIRESYRPLDEMLAGLDDARMLVPGVNGEWTAKDTLAHIAWWERHAVRRLRTGRDDLAPDDGNWEPVVNHVNAEVYAENRDRPLAEVRADFHAAHAEVLAMIADLPNSVLASDAIIEAIAVDTYGHYPEHVEALRSWIAGSSA